MKKISTKWANDSSSSRHGLMVVVSGVMVVKSATVVEARCGGD